MTGDVTTVSYRYTLTRRLPPTLLTADDRHALWVMLNPSTADEHHDDPTIRRVRRFTEDAGCARLTVVNLYAARATNPNDLIGMDDPVGPDNGATMARIILHDTPDVTVFAWGAEADRIARAHAQRTGDPKLAAHPTNVARWLEMTGDLRPQCLGVTRDGAPRHPLYVPATTPLRPWVDLAHRRR